jgi:hypothetical protein
VASALNGTLDVVQVFSTGEAFAALRSDGSVVTWGKSYYGGDSSAVASALNGTLDVVQVFSTGEAFAALRSDGSVVTWGSSDSSAVARALNGTLDVVQVFSTGLAFAALRSDGSVVTWGSGDSGDNYGGDSSAVASQLDGTIDVVSMANPYTNDVYIVNGQTGTVTINGTIVQGATLSVVSTLADVDGLGTLSYQWLADGSNIDGATASTFTLTQAQVGKAISVKASYTDGIGTAESKSSAATSAVGNSNDAPTGNVTLTGTAIQYSILTASNTLADVDGLGTISYQWLANGSEIEGATASTFTLTQAQVGKAISVKASYTDSFGAAESQTSTSTIAIVNINDAPTGTVSISGTITQGQILTASNTLVDVDGLGSISYQWLADGSNIDGATASTFTLTQAQVGKAISVKVSYTDGFGAAESKTSAATVVANINDAPTGTVSISGTVTQGQILTASNTLVDVDGLGSISYQWLADGSNIDGATVSTFTLTQAQVGKVISVKASYTDGIGTAESQTSTATTAVANINDAPTLITPLPDKTATGYTAFSHTLSGTAFSDMDSGDSLAYSTNILPDWLGFDATSRKFTGTPTNLNIGTFNITVTATDGSGASASDTFELTVKGKTNIVGTSANDLYYGTPNADTLNGGLGADSLIGGLGNDTYIVDNALDVVSELAEEGIDTIKSHVSYILNDNVENLVLSGNALIDGTGNSLANRITGNAAANVLDGGAGIDTLVGGAGHDTYLVDDSNDVIIEALNAGSDAVEATVSYVLADHVEGLFLMGTAAINGTGNVLANTLTGNSGNNILSGGAGNDTMNGGLGADTLEGGAGNDVFIVDNSKDRVVELAKQGTDTVKASISYTLPVNVENLTLTGTKAINATGNSLANSLTGNSANNILTGGAGNDTLSGGAGNDTLIGGAGKDKLTGGNGKDVFVFKTLGEMGVSATSRDVITDFVLGQDKIDLRGLDASQATSINDAFGAPTVGGQFSGVFANAGELYFDQVTRVLYGNTDANAAAEFAIALTGVVTLSALDLML